MLSSSSTQCGFKTIAGSENADTHPAFPTTGTTASRAAVVADPASGEEWNRKVQECVIVGSITLAPTAAARSKEPIVSTLLIVVLILVLLAVAPRWSYSARWGYGPSGIVGIILIVIIVLALLGRI
jgi:hypothetical protein